jgi:hypothetical protein
MSKIRRVRRLAKVVIEKIFIKPNREGVEHYDKVIAPEVLDDDFYILLQQLGSRIDLLTFLEIGSSSGAGSTQALVAGINLRESKGGTVLHCMEISLPRFEALKDTYSNFDFVKVHRLSSVGLDSFPTKSELKFFYKKFPSALNNYTFDEIYSWMAKDIEYLRMNIDELLTFGHSDHTGSGIEYIKREFEIPQFDFVLIDGGEFLGWAEFKILYGAKVIALDDINSYKCRYAYDALNTDSSYRLIAESWTTRNGWAIFEKN